MSSSWFSMSLPSPFNSEDSDDDDDPNPSSPPPQTPPTSDHAPAAAHLSVIGGAIGRQLRGVASFLAPPPLLQPPPESDSVAPSHTLSAIKNDLLEIGGSFRSTLSLFSPNKAVSEITRLASNLLQFESEDDDNYVEGYDNVAGVTNSIVEYAHDISFQAQYWTDFPTSSHEDFALSDAQQEHASAVEGLVPDLAALRHKMCNNMGEEKFWMIYFALLPPILNKHDRELLITPEIEEARTILAHVLNKRFSHEDVRLNLSQEIDKASDRQGESSLSREHKVFFGTVNAEEGVKINHDICEQRLEDKQLGSEEDVSFSDLEDDDNDLSGRLTRSKQPQHERVPSHSESGEWVRLNEGSKIEGGETRARSSVREKDSEGEDSHGWLTVDEVDF